MQTEHDLKEHYKKIKQRLNNAAIVARQKKAVLNAVQIQLPPQIKIEQLKPKPDFDKFPLARQIIILIAEKHEVAVEDILGSCRKTQITAARMEVMSELYKTGRYSLCQIGRILKKNHTSVLHAVRRLKALDSDKAIEGS